ncbi:MAG: PQQ-binding-like beta-propeller repeat protein [Candidatus Eremiobacteraeota bacterium]|nr:PQQ-binding-like beta-propeller repeat protein [Candidatus Eremiobacteraeota bacterium]
MTFFRFSTAKIGAGAVFVAGVLSLAAPAPAQVVTQWTQFLGNSAHTSHIADPSISTSNASGMGVKWMANLFNTDLGSPVVGFNSTLQKEVVYVGDERADMYAIDAETGQVIWSTNLGFADAIRTTPAIAPDGSVWVGTVYNPTMYRLDGATGQTLCSIKSPDAKPLEGSPMIASPPGGKMSVYWDALDSGGQSPIGPFVGSDESNCQQLWTQSVSSGSWVTAAFAVNGAGEPLVLVGTADPSDTEYALDALTGNIAWTYQTFYPPGHPGYDIGAAATISPPGNNGFANGVAYVSNEYGSQAAVDLTTGKALWTHAIYAPNFGGKRYIISSSALAGNQLVSGYFNGLISLNATTGNQLWNWTAPAGVDASPAIIGPSGREVVAFADLTGAFRVFSLSAGSQLYSYQTGNYVVASPAEYNGKIYFASADGFLYAFGAGGGNGGKPAEIITSPANNSVVANPNGSLIVTGTASDGSSVKGVEIAVQANGASGPWFDGATNSWNSGPYRNSATLANPGSSSTSWSFALPVPASGGTYEVFANAVNGANIVDKGSAVFFTVSPSKNQPIVHTSAFDTPPGSTFSATGNAFKPGETATFTLLGATVGTATVGKTGNVPKTVVSMPATAPFGPTSLTITGQTSGKSASATVFVTNEWTQAGNNALRGAQEPNDSVIANTIFVGQSVLTLDWMYSTGAAINTSPAVVNGVGYFGNDAGVLTAIHAASGSPAWTYRIPSGAKIHSSPAVDPTGQVIFGANDGNLYVLNSAGTPVTTVALGGALGSPAYANGNIIIASAGGNVYSLADPGFTTNWTAGAGGAITVSPVYDASAGVVVVGTATGNVTAYDATTGAVKWTQNAGGAVGGLAMANNAVYAGSADGSLYAYATVSGAFKWKAAGDGTAVTAVAVHNGAPTTGTAGGTLFDFNVAGTQVRHRKYGTEAIVGLGGAAQDVFGTTDHGNIGLLRDGDGGFYYSTGSTFGAAPVVLDGMLFAGASDGNLYALTPQGYNPPPQVVVRVGSVVVTVNGSCTP